MTYLTSGQISNSKVPDEKYVHCCNVFTNGILFFTVGQAVQLQFWPKSNGQFQRYPGRRQIIQALLCLLEKLAIAECPPRKLLNNRSEILSKCIHRHKFELRKKAASTKVNQSQTNNNNAP